MDGLGFRVQDLCACGLGLIGPESRLRSSSLGKVQAPCHRHSCSSGPAGQNVLQMHAKSASFSALGTWHGARPAIFTSAFPFIQKHLMI